MRKRSAGRARITARRRRAARLERLFGRRDADVGDEGRTPVREATIGHNLFRHPILLKSHDFTAILGASPSGKIPLMDRRNHDGPGAMQKS